MDIDFDIDFRDKVVLFVPLNWGLGHATRCVPLITLALSIAKKVIIASDGGSLALLRAYYPQVESYELPSYNVKYKFESMLINAMLQAPNALKAIRLESKEVDKIVIDHEVDSIVSDNRYGCHNHKCKNIFITHQLNIKFRTPIIKEIINYQNRKWISKFDQIWVPDYSDSRLSGELSNQNKISKPVKFIGPQSIHTASNSSKVRDILILLSGPEPQRTYLEENLIAQLQYLSSYKILFVGGKQSAIYNTFYSNHTYCDIMIGDQLTTAFNESSLIVCRSGYSTIMDIDKIGIKSIFIPTPGQTEQIYLAKLHQRQENSMTIKQSEIEDKLLPAIKALL